VNLKKVTESPERDPALRDVPTVAKHVGGDNSVSRDRRLPNEKTAASHPATVPKESLLRPRHQAIRLAESLIKHRVEKGEPSLGGPTNAGNKLPEWSDRP